MTREEAIKEIRMLYVQNPRKAWSYQRTKACEMAIKSLEAWDKILKDVRRYELNCHFGADETKCKLCNNNVFGSIQSIIKKHLKEVEANEDRNSCEETV